jgi:hypothetical protein
MNVTPHWSLPLYAIASFSMVLTVVATVYLFEITSSLFWPTTRYLQRFYRTLVTDQSDTLIFTIAIVLVTSLATGSISLGGNVFAELGVGLTFTAAKIVVTCRKKKIAGKSLRIGGLIAMLCQVLLLCLFGLYVIYQVDRGHYIPTKAWLLQVSVLYAGLVAYFQASQFRWILQTGKMQLGATFRQLFSIFKSKNSPDLVGLTEKMMKDFNEHVEHMRAERRNRNHRLKGQRGERE